MYSVCVRSHLMIAHSFRGDVFGPAQRLHGATYVIDVEFRRPELDVNGIVVDIGRAGTMLSRIVDGLNFTNLDENPAFAGKNTTTEFMARIVFDRVVEGLEAGELGPDGRGVTSLRVVLHESHVAWAAYEAEL